MGQIFCTILFIIVAILLTKPVNSVGFVFAINPPGSRANLQNNYPANLVSENPDSKEIISIIFFILSMGLVKACKEKNGENNNHGKNSESQWRIIK